MTAEQRELRLSDYLKHMIEASALACSYVESRKSLEELRQKHGQELETWWQERFGYAFDRLTQSEARYLARSQVAETSRNRIAAAEQAGNRG